MSEFTIPDSISCKAFQDGAWNTSHSIWRAAVSTSEFITSAEVDLLLDVSLLRWPYFTLLKDGRQPPMESYTLTRDVIGQQRSGYPNGPAIRRAMKAGASLKLNQVGDWHRPTRRLRESIENNLPVAVSSYVFWTPGQQRGMLPHRDASHVLAIQLEGVKEWEIYADTAQIRSSAGLDVNASAPSHRFRLEPGDVLYLPHGWPHAARAVDGPSVHLTFTMTEPAAADLVEALASEFGTRHPGLTHGYHRLSLEDRIEAVLSSLTSDVAELDADTWVQAALRTMRKAMG